MVPEVRVRGINTLPLREEGDYVLYWMIAFRRPGWNFALDRAVDHARDLDKPLVILEALRCDYRWASDRLHRFILDGMADNREAFADQPVLYHPYVEPEPGAGSGLLAALAERACVVVTDDFPSFMLPRMVAAAGRLLDVRLEAVDSNGLYPLRATSRVFLTAFSFRAHLQKQLPEHLGTFPRRHPLSRIELPRLGKLPGTVARKWPAASDALLEGDPDALAALPIDHDVPVVRERGGTLAGRERLKRFLEEGLPRYDEERNEPEKDVTSGLSPWLHFGHVSAQEIFAGVAKREDWSPEDLGKDTGGKRSGWWGMSAAAEGFLDQLVTWRELGYNMSAHRPDHDTYESLPPWAIETLGEHEKDERPHLYSLEEFEAARTHDPLWNAAQRQLATEGTIHNYLRMVWGKKILEWSRTPREALEVMIELNNKYALDGRNPNSYSGIFWTLGRYDRPWGPERPIFGKIRYMSSENTARKVRVKDYLERYGDQCGLFDGN